MKKEKSIFELLRKYRNSNVNISERYYKMKKKGIKPTNFSSLYFICEDETTKAYLDPHLHIVIIVNSDGYIDNVLYLYDRKIKFYNSSSIDDKLKIVLENYYKNTKYDFIESLYNNGFVSYFMYRKLKKECL
ncbi:MAG: hypothetical protein SOV26_05280 [Candidatus Onthovivens sp.]|nr:hypothetical protein [Candidatus Onthovivens sp.]